MLRLAVLGTILLLWMLAALALIGIVSLTNRYWSAKAGYLLSALVVAGAWVATVVLLRRARMHRSYRPSAEAPASLASKRR